MISDLLTKKVNQRICNVTTLKNRPFFADFDFDKLNDFKLTPPFVPVYNDLSENLNNLEKPYEDLVSQDNYVGVGKKERHAPPFAEQTLDARGGADGAAAVQQDVGSVHGG